MMEMKMYQHTCKTCGAPYEDSWEVRFICTDCENEYAEWIEEKGLVIGEFDCKSHPNFQPDVHKGTKWEHMNYD